MVSLKKIKQVQNISDLLKNSNNFVLIKFEGTNHQKLEELRKQLKKTDSKLKIVKITLLQKAINKLAGANKLFFEFGRKNFPLKENTALLSFTKKWSEGLSNFYKFLKDEKTLSFKTGILDNKIYGKEALLKIAQLPSKEELAAKLIGSMKSPLNHLIYSMKYNFNKLAYILKAKSQQNQ